MKKNKTITVTGAQTRANWETYKYRGYAEQPVKLQFKKKGTSAYKTLKTATTDGRGNLRTTTKAKADGYFRFSFAGTSTTPAVTSAADHLNVNQRWSRRFWSLGAGRRADAAALCLLRILVNLGARPSRAVPPRPPGRSAVRVTAKGERWRTIRWGLSIDTGAGRALGGAQQLPGRARLGHPRKSADAATAVGPWAGGYVVGQWLVLKPSASATIPTRSRLEGVGQDVPGRAVARALLFLGRQGDHVGDHGRPHLFHQIVLAVPVGVVKVFFQALGKVRPEPVAQVGVGCFDGFDHPREAGTGAQTVQGRVTRVWGQPDPQLAQVGPVSSGDHQATGSVQAFHEGLAACAGQ
ncbi:hypothetical protein ACGFZB_25890 [Streptomyces cinerochromogenes]|uniref:Uncharacterized protein n=1 Tax=Streptomyces cinerochromogenes TaxID=66422 RepID=A0ABW7BCN6_9ACTN